MAEKSTKNIRISTVILSLIIIILVVFIVWSNFSGKTSETTDTSADKSETAQSETADKEEINLCHFNPENGKNTDNHTGYDIIKTLNIENITLQITLNSDKEVVVEVFEGDEEEALDSEDSFVNGMKRKIGEPEIIKGFSCRVDEIEIGALGQDITSTLMLFLMEDGTVEYIGIKDILQTDNLASRGKIPELKNIVRLKSIDAHSSEGVSWMTTVAIDNTGAFFDIGNIIYELRIDPEKVN